MAKANGIQRTARQQRKREPHSEYGSPLTTAAYSFYREAQEYIERDSTQRVDLAFIERRLPHAHFRESVLELLDRAELMRHDEDGPGYEVLVIEPSPEQMSLG